MCKYCTGDGDEHWCCVFVPGQFCFPGPDLIRLESCCDRQFSFSFFFTSITELVYLQRVSVGVLVLIVFSPLSVA